MSIFKVFKEDSATNARLGVLTTPHGKVMTPSYVIVGTYGKIRYLSPSDLKKTKTQLIIANTFHLWNRALKEKKDFIHKSFGLKIPIMTDSGGFQVLSLAFGLDNKVGKFIGDDAEKTKKYKRKNVKITEKGVYFNYLGKKLFLGPKLSIQIQDKIGADILFAFDHITGPLDGRAYNQKALRYTDKWAKECLKEHARLQKNRKNKQALYGIIQGGIFKDLRIKSAKNIGAMPFDGFGIGGSYTKKQIAEILQWIIPYLPKEKPRHLLGVGKIEDIFEAVEKGIDTFDCVIPTREARHGRMYTKKGIFDIRTGRHAEDKKTIEPGCACPTCSQRIPKLKIRALLKSPDLKNKAAGQRWCLMHNMWFFNNLLENIRAAIGKNRYIKFRDNFLKKFSR